MLLNVAPETETLEPHTAPPRVNAEHNANVLSKPTVAFAPAYTEPPLPLWLLVSLKEDDRTTAFVFAHKAPPSNAAETLLKVEEKTLMVLLQLIAPPVVGLIKSANVLQDTAADTPPKMALPCCRLAVRRKDEPDMLTDCAATAPPAPPAVVSLKKHPEHEAAPLAKMPPPRPPAAVLVKFENSAVTALDAQTAPPASEAALERLNATEESTTRAARMAPPHVCCVEVSISVL
jgi:hypothetical protein